MTASTNADLQARRVAAVPRGVSTMLPFFASRAQGAEMWDAEGKRYIDFAGGIAVLNTGHNHPAIKAAVQAQIENFTHTCFQVMPYESYIALAEEINAIAPIDGDCQTLFVTTGAEAVENAVKLARIKTGRSGIIACSHGFHGRTNLTMALTGKVNPYKAGFGPFTPGIFHMPYPNEYHGVSVEEALHGLETLFKCDVDPYSVAAIIVEPVQGEGGFVVAPAEWLQAIRDICDKYGILMIVDEIQTGFARTGKMFAIEHSGVKPDLMTMAKSLAGGYPLSGVVGKKEIMDASQVGGLGGTYGGSPLGCTAGLAVLKVIKEEKLVERAQEIGTLMTDRLKAMQSRNSLSCIGDVRGLGAMIAMELVKDRDSKTPDAELTKALVTKCSEKGLVILSCGSYGNVIRFLVPLVASDALVNEGLDILESTLEELTAA